MSLKVIEGKFGEKPDNKEATEAILEALANVKEVADRGELIGIGMVFIYDDMSFGSSSCYKAHTGTLSSLAGGLGWLQTRLYDSMTTVLEDESE